MDASIVHQVLRGAYLGFLGVFTQGILVMESLFLQVWVVVFLNNEVRMIRRH